MALSTEPAGRRFSYADLAAFPHDNVIREIIDGELIVTPAPTTRHQRALMNLSLIFGAYRNTHGGDAFFAPTDVFLADDNVVEPDLLFVRADHLDRVELRFVNGPPDLVVEISSPSTRRIDIVRKSGCCTHDSKFPSTGSSTLKPSESRSTGWRLVLLALPSWSTHRVRSPPRNCRVWR
ncbi:MAG: Uma2 family endonuclease [Actinomycetota bacterium]